LNEDAVRLAQVISDLEEAKEKINHKEKILQICKRTNEALE